MNKIKHLIGNKTTIKNSITKEVEVPLNLDLLNKWTIPKVNTKTIYQLGTFERLGLKQVVKTTEESISLNNTEMVLQLLNNYDLEPYKDDGHKFIHIGLVQVAFKPLTMEGLPESFVAALRDARNLDWKKSIMGVIKTSLAHGPVYFDVYPNLTLPLSDDNILDALTLNVKTHGYNYAQGSEVICICYRIYFKPLFTLNLCCRLVDKQINETIIIETNFHKSDITTRRRIKWEEISFPDNWKIERAIQPKPIICTDLLNVTESDDGSVSLNFGNNQNRRPVCQKTNCMRSYISPHDYYTESPSTSRCSTSQLPDNTSDIFETDENERPASEPNKESKINEFKVDSNNLLRGHSNKNAETIYMSEARTKIKNEFNLPRWNIFRTWFFENFNSDQLNVFQKEFYECCYLHNQIFYFVPWFCATYVENYISVLERTYNLPNDKEVIGIYPPLQSFKMENCQFIALSKTLDNKEAYHITATHLNGLIQQENYANLFLKIVGEQIGSLHSKMDNILSLLTEKPEIKQDNNTNIASSSTEELVPPLIANLQNPPEIKNFIVKANHEWEEKLFAQAQVNKQVQKLLLEKMEQLSIQTLIDNRLYNSHASSAEDEINRLDTKWSQKPNQRLFYYSRPSPLDVLHEEQEFQINNSYNGKCIYEWNIDGHTDTQVFNQVHRMLMYSTICKQIKNSDSNIAKMIVSGFTGQLKGWWDNYLTDAMKASVYNAKTTGENPVENAVYTLTINIIEQFTGRFINNNENIRTLLQNLRCKTLTDYRWYKDTFLSRVMELPESRNAHWKAKFIDGLPHLFAERVKTALRGQHNAIPYDNYSYGKLIGTCTEQGLKLCNEIKLTQQIKRQHLTERNQLGDF
ncbi:hypothetical protein RND81_07G077700 [Saponaria officinalis]|uniref:Uncharacterized protein n=1 Tax=Saponaria officinalis TaxID=3572 RepID=A0AAW1JQ57_SAPOF